MPQLDKEGYCKIAEYRAAHADRLQVNELTVDDVAVMALYLSVKGKAETAFMSPVTVEKIRESSHHVGASVVTLAFLDADLQKKFTLDGLIDDGVWNTIKPGGLRVNTSGDILIDGVFGPYDDGLDADQFMEELVGAGASSNVDLGSFRL